MIEISKIKGNMRSLCTILLSVFVIGTGCNKGFEDRLSGNVPATVVPGGSGKRKVLYIILDGVRGSVVGELKPINLTKMQRNAIYSYNALTDYKTQSSVTNAAGWANMLTGVGVDKHLVNDENFTGAKIEQYPSFFSRLKQEIPGLKTYAIAASPLFNDKLAVDATEKTTLSTDEQVKETTMAKLKSDDADVVVSQFHSAETAGSANGYTTATTAYVAAITQLDAYVGELVEALKQRKTYSGENWLVIVASNKGGIDPAPVSDNSAFGDSKRNTYLMFYNPKLESRLVPKPSLDQVPYVGSAPRFLSDMSKTGLAVLNNTSVGNFGTSGNYTLMFKMRMDATNSAEYSYPLGKMSESQYLAPRTSSLNGTGWTYMFWSNSYYLCITNAFTHFASVNIRDGKWHVLGFKVYNNGATRYVKVFTDDTKSGEINVQGKDLSNAAAMHIGTAKATTASNGTNFLMRDLAIYNVALSDDDMITYMKREVGPSSPYFNNLIGWWPMKEGKDSRLNDGLEKGVNFNLSNTPWASFNDFSSNVYPEIQSEAYVTVPNGVDIPYQIYNWLGLPVAQSWGLDGRAWSGNFITTVTN